MPRIEGQMHAVYDQHQDLDARVSLPTQQISGSGRVFVVVPRDHGARGAVMEGIFLVNLLPARILFNFGASHSFISRAFILLLHLTPDVLDDSLSIATTLGGFSVLDQICRKCIVSLDDIQFRADLIVLIMSEFDIILGMDWLESYHVSIDCFDKTVCLRLPGQHEFVIATSQGNSLAEAYLAYIEEVLPRDQSVTLAETRVVFEFEDIIVQHTIVIDNA